MLRARKCRGVRRANIEPNFLLRSAQTLILRGILCGRLPLLQPLAVLLASSATEAAFRLSNTVPEIPNTVVGEQCKIGAQFPLAECFPVVLQSLTMK